MPQKKLVCKLGDICDDRGTSVSALAKKVTTVNRSTLYKISWGDIFPRPQTIVEICDLLNCKVSELLVIVADN